MKHKAWNASETLALAVMNCTECYGHGQVTGPRGDEKVCGCVLRSVFRICYNRFRYCSEKERHVTSVTLDRSELASGSGRYLWSRKEEEYVADFHLVSHRALSKFEWNIFRFHFLAGLDWPGCERRIRGLRRAKFFYTLYSIEAKLGRVFHDLEPYALFPIDEYFGGKSRPLDLPPEQEYVSLADAATGRVRLNVPLRGVPPLTKKAQC